MGGNYYQIAESTRRPQKKTVFIVDDHPLLRQGLTLMINREKDLAVCGEAEEAQAAMRASAAYQPDILIVDISLNGPDGLDLLKNIRNSDPGLPVLILSMHDERPRMRSARSGPAQTATS